MYHVLEAVVYATLIFMSNNNNNNNNNICKANDAAVCAISCIVNVWTAFTTTAAVQNVLRTLKYTRTRRYRLGSSVILSNLLTRYVNDGRSSALIFQPGNNNKRQ